MPKIPKSKPEFTIEVRDHGQFELGEIRQDGFKVAEITLVPGVSRNLVSVLKSAGFKFEVYPYQESSLATRHRHRSHRD